MPKKTKRQKLHADKVREKISTHPLSSPVEKTTKLQTVQSHTYSFSGIAQTKTMPVVSPHDQEAYTAMTKDITKTIIIAIVIFAAQAIIFWKLRM